MVAPKHAGHVKSYLSCSGMGVQVVSDNLQRQIDLENVVEDLPPTRSKGKFARMTYTCYIHLRLTLYSNIVLKWFESFGKVIQYLTN